VIFRITTSHLLSGIAATFLASCAAHQSSADIPQVVDDSQEPQSKPLKMPPTNRKLGSSNSIALDDFFQLQQAGNVLLYDVRNPYFHGIDHIPGAISWPHNQYDSQVQKRDIEIQDALNSGKKVVLYCFNRGCPEARNVAKKLARRDYDVRVLSAGIDSWRDAGLRLDRPEAAGNE
jgi:rhodanese-related sulfurtransferase